jgi:polyisoprenoid-binding protein YceI
MTQRHLTGPDVFDAEHHPEITYASTRIESVKILIDVSAVRAS